jgi:hypothetical protein
VILENSGALREAIHTVRREVHIVTPGTHGTLGSSCALPLRAPPARPLRAHPVRDLGVVSPASSPMRLRPVTHMLPDENLVLSSSESLRREV